MTNTPPRKPGRKPLGDRAMTDAERQLARRQRVAAAKGRNIRVTLTAERAEGLALARQALGLPTDDATMGLALDRLVHDLAERLR